MRSVASLLALACVVAGEQVFEDSPALTALWEASSSGSTEAFISQLIQNREYSKHRASDGRGPMFWAYEFKNVDTLALLMHLGVSAGAVIVPCRPTPRFPLADPLSRSSCNFSQSKRTLTARHPRSSSPMTRTRSRVRGQMPLIA